MLYVIPLVDSGGFGFKAGGIWAGWWLGLGSVLGTQVSISLQKKNTRPQSCFFYYLRILQRAGYLMLRASMIKAPGKVRHSFRSDTGLPAALLQPTAPTARLQHHTQILYLLNE